MKLSIRLISCFLLLAMFISSSGAVSIASALLQSGADACCDIGGTADFDGDDPCSAIGCGCESCQTTDVPAVPSLRFLPLPPLLHVTLVTQGNPHEFVAAIEYPPEAA